LTLCVCLLAAPRIARGAEPIPIGMTADRWQAKENAEFLRQLGFYHGLMRLNSGNATLKGVTFSDGTIEFDVNTIGRGAPGIAFRQQDEGSFELLYLRPDPACPAFRACIQYAPQTHGVLLWGDERFRSAMERARARLDERGLREFAERVKQMLAPEAVKSPPIERLVIKSGGTTRFRRRRSWSASRRLECMWPCTRAGNNCYTVPR